MQNSGGCASISERTSKVKTIPRRGAVLKTNKVKRGASTFNGEARAKIGHQNRWQFSREAARD
jgi:hypothetical protein